jgi:5'-deoxynucleotidase
MKILNFIDDMSNVRRWSHAYCHKEESVLEHTAIVSIISLYIAANTGAKMATVLERSLLHDMEEVITGDIPTPTKYHNRDITREIQKFEDIAAKEVSEIFGEWAYRVWCDSKDDSLEGDIIKIADTAAVAFKIRQEIELGNNSFAKYEENVWTALYHIKCTTKHKEQLVPYIHDFMDYLMAGKDNV